MSTIAAGTTSTTALVSTADTTGNLVLQVNGTTPSLTLNTAGAYGVGSSPSYGTSGQVLTSAGSAAAPTWNTVTAGINADPRTILTTKTVSYGSTLNILIVSTLYLTSTKQLLIVKNAAGTTYYATVYDSSTDTMGSAVTIATSVSTTSTPGVSAYAISGTSVIIGYMDTSVPAFKSAVLSISGTTITVGTVTSVAMGAVTSGIFGSDLAVCGSSYVFYIYAGSGSTSTYLVACTVSGTTVTAGSLTTVTSTARNANFNLPVVAYSTSNGFVTWVDGTSPFPLKMCGFSVSGTTVTVSGTIVTPSASGYSSNYITNWYSLASGRIMFVYNTGTAPNYVLCSMSGSTLSISTYQSSNTLGGTPIILVSGSALLVASLAASNDARIEVVYDSAGTIANSATTTVTSSGFISFSAVYGYVSGSTLKTIFSGASNSAAATITIVANAPSISYDAGVINNSYPTAGFPTSNPVNAGASRLLNTNNLGTYPLIIGSSGTAYAAVSGTSIVIKGYTTSGTYQNYGMNGYYFGASYIDPTNSACQWFVTLPSGSSSTSATFYRVQYA